MNCAIWKMAVLGAALVLNVSCGNDDEPKAKAAEVNQQVAVTSTQSTITAVTALMDGDDGEAAAGTVLAMGLTYQGVLTPTGGTAAGTCDCDATAKTCTFEDCSDDTGISTMNGTISWGNGKVMCDLTLVSSTSESGYDMDYEISVDCDLTVTETSIDGTLDSSLSMDMSGNGQDVSVDVDTAVTFNEVTWDAVTKQPTGGSVDVEASMTSNAEGSEGTYEGSAHISFP